MNSIFKLVHCIENTLKIFQIFHELSIKISYLKIHISNIQININNKKYIFSLKNYGKINKTFVRQKKVFFTKLKLLICMWNTIMKSIFLLNMLNVQKIRIITFIFLSPRINIYYFF